MCNRFGVFDPFQIILLLKDQNKYDEMVEFAHRACRLYQQQGSPEAGAGALEKTAKMVEQKDPASAINVLQHAVEVLMVNQMFKQIFRQKINR